MKTRCSGLARLGPTGPTVRRTAGRLGPEVIFFFFTAHTAHLWIGVNPSRHPVSCCFPRMSSVMARRPGSFGKTCRTMAVLNSSKNRAFWLFHATFKKCHSSIHPQLPCQGISAIHKCKWCNWPTFWCNFHFLLSTVVQMLLCCTLLPALTRIR
jgi:hypothetical protein